MLARTGNGYLVDPTTWSLDVMNEMAKEDDIELTESQVMQIEKAREYFEENSSVPPIRTFAKYVGIDKGKLFKEWLTGPLKPITKYGVSRSRLGVCNGTSRYTIRFYNDDRILVSLLMWKRRELLEV